MFKYSVVLMTIEEVVDNRKGFFERPSTVRDILEGKKVIDIYHFKDILPAAEERKSGEALLIHPEAELIPDEYYDSVNFSKRGPLVTLNTFSGIKSRLMKEEWTPLKARIEAEKRYENSKRRFVGFMWRDPEGVAHVVQPWTVLEGHKIHHYSQNSRNIADRIEGIEDIKLVKTYSSKDSRLTYPRIRVPSKSGAKKHEVILEGMPHFSDPKRFVDWTRFRTRHDCDYKREDFTLRYGEKPVINYCPHDVAAHVFYSKIVAEKSRKIVLQPFPLIREAMVRLYNTLINHAMHIEEIGKGKRIDVLTRKKPIPKRAMNSIFMEAWKTHGNKYTFYVPSPTKGHKRLRDFNWSSNAPGMEF
jgi:hypothetical protein